MANKEYTFYGIVTDIGDLVVGPKSKFYPITMSDGQGDTLEFLLFDNQENELQMVEESHEEKMTLEITYTENRKGSKTYTNPIKDGIIWADDADAVDSDDVESEGKKTKGKEAQTHIAKRKGKEAFEPAINKEKQESIQTQVALKEVGEMMRCGMLQADAIDSRLVQAYWAWLEEHLTKTPDLVEKAKEILGAEETSRQSLSKPTKKQMEAINRLLEKAIFPEVVDLKEAAIAKYGKGYKMTGDDARDWLHELQKESNTPPPEDAPSEEPF